MLLAEASTALINIGFLSLCQIYPYIFYKANVFNDFIYLVTTILIIYFFSATSIGNNCVSRKPNVSYINGFLRNVDRLYIYYYTNILSKIIILANRASSNECL